MSELLDTKYFLLKYLELLIPSVKEYLEYSYMLFTFAKVFKILSQILMCKVFRIPDIFLF